MAKKEFVCEFDPNYSGKIVSMVQWHNIVYIATEYSIWRIVHNNETNTDNVKGVEVKDNGQ